MVRRVLAELYLMAYISMSVTCLTDVFVTRGFNSTFIESLVSAPSSVLNDLKPFGNNFVWLQCKEKRPSTHLTYHCNISFWVNICIPSC